jgi:hypothetical protein
MSTGSLYRNAAHTHSYQYISSVFKLLSLLIFCVTFDCLFLNINFNIQTYKSYFIFCHIFCYDLTYNWVSHSLHLQCIWTHNCPDSLIDDVMNIFSARNTYFFLFALTTVYGVMYKTVHRRRANVHAQLLSAR